MCNYLINFDNFLKYRYSLPVDLESHTSCVFSFLIADALVFQIPSQMKKQQPDFHVKLFKK